MLNAKRKSSIAILLTAATLLAVSVSASGIARASIDPAALTRATTKDTCTGYTSKLNVECVGNLVYYGSTGFSAETEAETACKEVYAMVEVYDPDYGQWIEIDEDSQTNTTSADAAGQYGSGTEDSRGYHYVTDNSNGTWGSKLTAKTEFSYDN